MIDEIRCFQGHATM